MLQEFINKSKNRIDLVYGKIFDTEYLFLKNGILQELWIRDFLPNILNNDLTNFSPGIMQEAYNLTHTDFERLLSNGVVLLIKNHIPYIIHLTFIPKRNPTDSIADPSNLFGSRDGFNEIIADNRILIKRRIKSNNLQFDEIIIGDSSQTEVNIVYLKNKKTSNIVNKIKSTLLLNKHKNIISAFDINKILTNNNMIPTLQFTGSPETCCNALLKNRIVILIDNTPISILIPASLLEMTENTNEINSFKVTNIINRLLIILFLFTTIFSIGLFIVLTSHHPEALSTLFISNFQISERGTILPLVFEIIVILILFEFYRQMVSRSPLSFVQNIIIIFGGIFIGQNAVEANIIGTTSIIVTSLSYVTSFAVTNNSYLITTFSIFRIFILLFSFTLGLVGFIISSVLVINFLANINIFNQYYLEPIIPFNLSNLKEWFIPRKD